MKSPITKLICTACVLALLLAPVAALAKGGVVATLPAEGLNTSFLYLNAIPLDAERDAKGGVVIHTGDLAAAVAGAERVGASNGATSPSDLLIRNGELFGGETLSDGRLQYPEDLIKNCSPRLIEGVTKLIAGLDAIKDQSISYSNKTTVADIMEASGLNALLEYVTSKLSGDPVTSEDFDDAMRAIYTMFCRLDELIPSGGDCKNSSLRQLTINDSYLMYKFIYTITAAGYSLPSYLRSYGIVGMFRGPWRIEDYAKLDDARDAAQKQKLNTSAVELKGKTIIFNDANGKELAITMPTVGQKAIIKDVTPYIEPIAPPLPQ